MSSVNKVEGVDVFKAENKDKNLYMEQDKQSGNSRSILLMRRKVSPEIWISVNKGEKTADVFRY